MTDEAKTLGEALRSWCHVAAHVREDMPAFLRKLQLQTAATAFESAAQSDAVLAATNIQYADAFGRLADLVEAVERTDVRKVKEEP